MRTPEPYYLFLAVVELFRLVVRFAGEVHAQTLEHVLVNAGEDDGRVHVAARKRGEGVHGLLRVWIRDGADGQGYEHLVRVQPRVVIAHVLNLQMLYGFDDAGRDERDVVRYAAQVFERVEQAGAGGAEQG